MRAILLVFIIALLAIVGAIATGLLNINQTRGARAPDLATTQNGVVAKGGQAPAFDVETGSVKIGTQDARVKLPSVQVQRPGNQAAPAPGTQPGTTPPAPPTPLPENDTRPRAVNSM